MSFNLPNIKILCKKRFGEILKNELIFLKYDLNRKFLEFILWGNKKEEESIAFSNWEHLPFSLKIIKLYDQKKFTSSF